MGLAIIGVIVLVFIGLTVLSAKTWQVWHALVVFGLFAATFGFMILAAATLKTQDKWRTQYETLQVDKERAEKSNEQLVQEDAAETSELRRTLVDRGRVWRNLQIVDGNEETGEITLDGTTWGDDDCYQQAAADDFGGDDFGADEDEGDGDGQAPDPVPAGKPMGLEQGSVVFAFLEASSKSLNPQLQQLLYPQNSEEEEGVILPQRDAEGNCKVPVAYIGEFTVVSIPNDDPTAIKLEPAFPLSDYQKEILANGIELSWVLYEIMPVDSHDLAEMTDEQIDLWLGDLSGNEQRPLVLDEYQRDQASAEPNDPPERKWMKVTFKAGDEIEVDATEESQVPEEPFDGSGQARAKDLQYGEAVSVSNNDELWFDFASAQELIQQQKADPGEVKYVRQLRDYARQFRINAGQIDAAERQNASLLALSQKLTQQSADLQAQIVVVEERRRKWAEDSAGFQMELAVINEYKQALEQEWESVRSELSRLYRANKQQVRQNEGAASANASTRRSL